MNFSKNIIKKAQENPLRLLLPEGCDPRILLAANQILEQKIASEITILGDPAVLKNIAEKENISLDGLNILDFQKDPRIHEFAHEYYEQRKHKNLSEEQALKEMKDDVFFGGKLLSKGYVDAMVSGSISPSAKTLRAAIFFAKPLVKTICGIFIMETEHKDRGTDGLLIFGDCAVVPNPTPEQLVDISISCAQAARKILGIEPKVAFLSFSTLGSAVSEETQKVVKAVELLRSKNVDFEFDGEMQLDAAVEEEIAKLKAPGSSIAGKSNVLIFPDLSSGNIGYKMVHRFSKGAQAYGPLLQGLEKPINDLSRGCSVEDIVITSAITLVQAGAK